MAKNKPSLRDLLHEFAEETSAHGAIKISSAKSVFWRIFWVLVSLACLGMVIYQGILLLNTYLDKPTKSDIDVTYIRVSSTTGKLMVSAIFTLTQFHANGHSFHTTITNTVFSSLTEEF